MISSCWPILSSHRWIAKFSRLSGLSACAAVSRKGTARAARLVHTHVFAKLAAASARQKKLQQCRRFTWRFASKIFKILPSNHDCCWAFVSISSYTHYCVWTFMSTYRHLTPKKYDCHSAFSFMLQQTSISDLTWRHLQIFTLRTIVVWETLGTLKHHHISSANPAHRLTCGRAKGCTIALVAAIVNAIATESCKPFALATTETKNTATSFWTISIQIFLPGYARSVKRVKKQQILRCLEVGKMPSFYLKTFCWSQAAKSVLQKQSLCTRNNAVTRSDILQNTPLCQHFANTPALPGSIQAQ